MLNEKITVERPKELVELDNLFARGVNFIDEHIREVQYGIYGLAFIGSVIVIRSLRVFGRFRRAHDIPSSFISKNVTLRGIVRRVNPENGALMVEHIPVIQIRKDVRPDELLPVALTGVRVGSLGYQWLDIAVRNQSVGFTLLAVNPRKEVECTVTPSEGLLKNRCLNTEIVQLGLAQVASKAKYLQNNKIYSSLYTRLLHLENKALRERNGVWSTIPLPQSGSSLRNSFNKMFQGSFEKFWNLFRRSKALRKSTV